jgi:hypothetical protein
VGDFPEGLTPVFIHNSDIQGFKGCRERWNWLSDIREGWKPEETPTPFYFGSAIHRGEEIYYSPATWDLVLEGGPKREAVIMAALQGFLDHMADTKKRYLRITKSETLDDKWRETFEEHLDLGRGMLLHYFEWVWKRDVDYGITPLGVEWDFVVPVFDTYEEQLAFCPTATAIILVFRGRIDMLCKDKDGRVWILDHKTTSRMPDNLRFLEMDEQMGSYIMGYSLMSGQRIAGAIYNEILKGYPVPPSENANLRLGRRFSVAKNQYTSYDVYLKTITEAGEDVELYTDFLQWLKDFGPTYIRRTEISRNTRELMGIRERIKNETADMINDPRIYPHPGRWSCDNCPTAAPCLAKMEGQDYEWILQNNFVKESRTNA